MKIQIERVTEMNQHTAERLQVTADQKRFIESNAESLREMVVDSKYAWQCYIFSREGEAVGFMMVGAEHQTERYIWLDRFMVDKAYQGNGIGSACLQAALDYIKGQHDVDEVVLSLHHDNTAAKRFYTKQGFQDSGLIDQWNGEAIWSYSLTKNRPS